MVATMPPPEAAAAPPAGVSFGAVGVAGLASLGAGAIHAAAIGAHNEHRSVVVTFAVLAAFQLAWGAAAVSLRRPKSWFLLLGIVGNGAAFVGWVLAKTTGISFITGLDEAEGIQLADGAAAALAVVAVVLAGRALLVSGRETASAPRALLPIAAVPIAILTLSSMIAAGSHSHAGGHAHGGDDGHSHDTATLVAPFVADAPIDLGGVPGVSAEEQAQAEDLLQRTMDTLPQFDDTSTLNAQGFYSIGDGVTGDEHYMNWGYVNDDTVLDPAKPESLVFRRDGGQQRLVAAMYMLPEGSTFDDVPDVGGSLVQWHVHGDLCLTDDPVAPRLAFSDLFAGTTGECTPPNSKRANVPMVHVWIEDNPCGPFASLEGVGAGQVQEGQQRQCTEEHAHSTGG